MSCVKTLNAKWKSPDELPQFFKSSTAKSGKFFYYSLPIKKGIAQQLMAKASVNKKGKRMNQTFSKAYITAYVNC